MSTTSLTRLPVTTTIDDNTQFIIQQGNTLSKVLWRTAKNDATKGFSGSKGTAGFTGSGALPGFTGSRGIPGATGFIGSRGPGGLGYTGSRGFGFTGSQGFTGNQGDVGHVGSQGPRGFTGSIHWGSVPSNIIPDTNNQIDIGSSSFIFRQAHIFEVRTTRITDPNGVALNLGGGGGYIGSTGATGFTGSQGIIGSTGYRGSIGEHGYTGSGGLGYTGSTGIGYTGSSASGFIGSQGDLGYTGSKGEDGTSVTIIGSVNSSASLDPVYTGDVGDGYISQDNGHLWVWNGSGWVDAGEIRGPQGIIGFTGSDGYVGSSGVEGYTGSSGVEGYTGSAGTSISITGNANEIQINNGSGGLTSSEDFVFGRPEDNYGLGLLAGTSINFWKPNNEYSIELKSPTNLTEFYILKLPNEQGAAGTFLKNDGLGNLSWETATGGGGATYSISAEPAGLDAILRLTGSNSTQDDVTLVAGSNVLITVTDANTIQIAAATGAEAMKENLIDLNDVLVESVTNGQILQWNGTKWVNANAPSGGGGGGTTFNARSNISFTTPVLAPNTPYSGEITGPKGYMLYKITTNKKCWIRIYSGLDTQLSDASRPNNIDPLPGSGVIADVTFANDNSTVIFAPAVMGWNEEETDKILYRIDNLGAGNTAIQIILTVVRLEL